MLAQSAPGHPNLAAIAGGNVVLQVVFPSLFSNSSVFFAPALRPPQTIFPGRYSDPDTIFSVTVLRLGGNITAQKHSNSNFFFAPSFLAAPKEIFYDYKLPDPSAAGDYGRRKLFIGRGRVIGRLGK